MKYIKQVILDEKSNIIIDDEETKRKIHRMKMLHRRRTLESDAPINDLDGDDLSESTSTDDTTDVVCVCNY